MSFKVGEYIICDRNLIGGGLRPYICQVISPKLQSRKLWVKLISAPERGYFNLSVSQMYDIYIDRCKKLTVENVADILNKHVIRDKEHFQNYLKERLIQGLIT